MRTSPLLSRPILGFCLCLLLTSTMITGRAYAIDIPKQPRLISELSLATGTEFSGVEFGGISGLFPTGAEHEYLAISDDRSEHAPARFYRLSLSPSDDIWQFKLRSSHTLKTVTGKPFASGTLDPETIALLPSGDILWSSEGDKDHRPTLYLADRSGLTRKIYPLPQSFMHNKKKKTGIRRNRGPEGMTLIPGGKRALLAMEDALYQDGKTASLKQGALIRLLEFDIENGQWGAQYAYPTDPVPRRALLPPFIQVNGVTDILWMDESRLLVLERAYSAGVGNTIKVFVTTLTGATPWREDQPVMPLPKKLWFEIPSESFGELKPDNLEAMAFGPVIDGKRTLILASDNNFNRLQKNQFLILEF